MAGNVAVAGPAELSWDPDRRRAVLRFVEVGVGGRAEAETLLEHLRAWVGDPPRPYQFLVDCSRLSDADAAWRSLLGQHFRAHRDVATLSWFGANPRVRLLILLFLKGTGVHGQPFSVESEALAWLDAQRPR